MMLYKREGFPEEGEIVLCTVTKINPNSVFVHLNDFNKSGLIHISEIAPGRIRNIREYVAENKVIVCYVLSVNKERGHIDLSLRRVSESARRNKLAEIKQELIAEKIVELVAKQTKKDVKTVYSEISKPVFEKYPMLHYAFLDVSQDKISISDLNIPKEYQSSLDEQIRKRFRPEKVIVGGILKLQTFAPNGIGVIKNLLKEIEKIKNAEVRYLGAGSYRVKIDTEDAKSDEKALDKKIEEVLASIRKQNGEGSFTKEAAEE
jgi:translation initiation factor 2 subunit 1